MRCSLKPIHRGRWVRISGGFAAATVAGGLIFACATNDDGVPGQPAPDSTPAFSSASNTPTPPPPPPPPDEDAGTTDAGPSDAAGDYSYGPWGELSGCSATCDAGTKSRTRECRRRDGVPVNCRLCGGECTDNSTPCVGVSTCCGPRETCCVRQGYNVVNPDKPGCNATLVGLADKCEAKGCLWNGARACTLGGAEANPTLMGARGVCE